MEPGNNEGNINFHVTLGASYNTPDLTNKATLVTNRAKFRAQQEFLTAKNYESNNPETLELIANARKDLINLLQKFGIPLTELDIPPIIAIKKEDSAAFRKETGRDKDDLVSGHFGSKYGFGVAYLTGNAIDDYTSISHELLHSIGQSFYVMHNRSESDDRATRTTVVGYSVNATGKNTGEVLEEGIATYYSEYLADQRYGSHGDSGSEYNIAARVIKQLIDYGNESIEAALLSARIDKRNMPTLVSNINSLIPRTNENEESTAKLLFDATFDISSLSTLILKIEKRISQQDSLRLFSQLFRDKYKPILLPTMLER